MSQHSLAEIQIQLQNYLLDKESNINHFTQWTRQFSQEERLGIYHQAYRLRLQETLANDFPALKKYLGSDEFNALTLDYIAHCPSQHTSLRWFGEKLSDFLQGHDQYQNNIAAIELCQFEWVQVMAFDAADTLLLDLEALRNLPPTEWLTLTLQFHPSVQLLDFFCNTPEGWSALIKTQTPWNLKIGEAATGCLMWRENLNVMFREPDVKEAFALKTFIQKGSFSDVCEGLCEWSEPEQVPAQAAQYLQRWIGAGMIIGTP